MSVDPAEFRFRKLSSNNGTPQAKDDVAQRKAFGERLNQAIRARGVTASEISAESGIPKSTLSRYQKGESLPKSEHVFPLSDAVEVDPRWLIAGETRRADRQLLRADDAEWIDIGEYDLREMTDESRGPAVSTTPFRRDWLSRTFGLISGLWLTRLPADLPAAQLLEGDHVFVRDVADGERQEGATYIFRALGHLHVARIDGMKDAAMEPLSSNIADRRIAFRHVGFDDGQAVPVARVLGVPLKRL